PDMGAFFTAAKNERGKSAALIFTNLSEIVSSGSRFRVDHLLNLTIDGDAARLLFLGHNPLEVNVEQTVFELRALDLDILRQLEPALNSPPGDTLIQVRLWLGCFSFA